MKISASTAIRYAEACCAVVPSKTGFSGLLDTSHWFFPLWKKMEHLMGCGGFQVEYIPIDDKPYCVTLRYPDSTRELERAKTECEALWVAIEWWKSIHREGQ